MLVYFEDPPTTRIYTLSLHDALPISADQPCQRRQSPVTTGAIWPGSPTRTTCALSGPRPRSEEHTSELQSHSDLVCRLLLEKKNTRNRARPTPRTRQRARKCRAERLR